MHGYFVIVGAEEDGKMKFLKERGRSLMVQIVAFPQYCKRSTKAANDNEEGNHHFSYESTVAERILNHLLVAILVIGVSLVVAYLWLIRSK